MVLILSFPWSKLLAINASFYGSFTFEFPLFGDALQAVEVIEVKRVNVSTSSVVGEVAGFL
jgi:hypothetical protein